MAAPVDNTHKHRAEGINNAVEYRERMFAIAAAAKITAIPTACPKCHAPDHCFVRYPHSLECNMCGWTGYFPNAIAEDDVPLEVPRSKEEKLRAAGYSRVNGMSPTRLQRHMELTRAARKK